MFQNAYGQKSVERKGRIFFYWGYNRAAYTTSDFHISGEGYDLTFNDIKAKDKPSPFSAEQYFKPENISQPQYNYRLGYYLSDKLSISIGMDHLKYYMIEDQTVNIDGTISPEASSTYQGTYNGEPTVVPWRFFWVHHSDGLNYTSAELEYNLPVWVSSKKNFYVDVIGNAGIGVVIPKSFVMILDEGEDNKFHLAGGGANLKAGARFTFWKNFYLETAVKSGYVFMPKILVNGDNTAQAHQRFGWIEYYAAFGFSVPLTRPKSEDNNAND